MQDFRVLTVYRALFMLYAFFCKYFGNILVICYPVKFYNFHLCTLTRSKKCPSDRIIGQRTIWLQIPNIGSTISGSKSVEKRSKLEESLYLLFPNSFPFISQLFSNHFPTIFQHHHSPFYRFPTVSTNQQSQANNMWYFVLWVNFTVLKYLLSNINVMNVRPKV